MENNKILIRMLEKEEKPEALELIWEVFSRLRRRTIPRKE